MGSLKHWPLLTPLSFVRTLLQIMALPAMALAIMMGGAFGALVPYSLLESFGVRGGVAGLVAIADGIGGMAVAFALGAWVSDSIRRLRAPIGTAAFGADGIRWRHMWTTEFIGWASVREIVDRGTSVVVRVEGRPDVVLLVSAAALFVDDAKRALQAYRDGAPPQTIAALELAGDGISEWLARARDLLRGGSYRDAGVDEEQCIRVATDPRAPLAQRIGSAAALAKASPEARERVRVAIEETADPLVAHALDDALAERDNPRALAPILRR